MLNLSSCICITSAAATSSWWCYTPDPTEGELLTMDLLSTSVFIQQQCLGLPNVHKEGLRSHGAQNKKSLQGISYFEKTCSFHSHCVLAGATGRYNHIYTHMHTNSTFMLITYTVLSTGLSHLPHCIKHLIATEFLGWRVSLVSSAWSLNPKLLQRRKVT